MMPHNVHPMDLALSAPNALAISQAQFDAQFCLLALRGPLWIHLGALWTPDHPDFEDWCRTRPIDRVLGYAYALQLSEHHDERYRWHQALQQHLRAHNLLPNLTPEGVYARYAFVKADGHGHWRWMGHRPRTGEPAVNIWGQHDVPVYKVLWALYRPGVAIPPGRRAVRTPGVGCGPNDDPPCVHPDHFYISDPAVLPAKSWRGNRKVTGLPPNMVRWHVGEDGWVYCSRWPDHRLGDAIQQRYRQQHGALATYVYCAECHKLRKEAIHDAVPSIASGPPTLDEQRILDEWREDDERRQRQDEYTI